jgi:8-oxo-dGTP diphosphatase
MLDAVVILLREGTRVLAIQRAAGISRGGHWAPPSGRVEPGESPAETVVREAREELGIVVRAVREVWRCPSDDQRYLLHWWLAEALTGPLDPDPAEIAAMRWVTAAEYLALSPGFASHRPFFASRWALLDPLHR